MAASLCPLSTQAGTSQNVMSVGLRKDWDKYLRECLCKIPPTPLTLVVIEEIIESPMDSGALASKKGKPMPAIKGFTPLVLALLAIAEPSPRFVQKGTLVVLAI